MENYFSKLYDDGSWRAGPGRACVQCQCAAQVNDRTFVRASSELFTSLLNLNTLQPQSKLI